MDEAAGAERWSRICEPTPRRGDGSPDHQQDGHGEGSEFQAEHGAFANLVRAIETEIIPRLMLAHRPVELRTTGRGSAEMAGTSEVVEFTNLLLSPDPDVAAEHMRAKRAAGVAVDALFLQLFSAAARRLGELWLDDACSFTDVTIGVSRLHAMVRELSPAFQDRAGSAAPRNRKALLVPTPGEQHTFGLFMLSEFFRRDGWDVWGDPGSRAADLADKVKRERFDLVGFSLSGERLLDSLRDAISTVRSVSRNPGVVVMVGGSLFVEQPDLVKRVGADATAKDAPQALTTAEDLLRSVEAGLSGP